MGLRLNGSTSGFVELNAPAVAGTATLELPTDSIKPGIVLVATTSFSNVATVSIDNCFTTIYDQYLLVTEVDTASAALNVRIRFRAAGVDDSTTNYATQYTQATGTANATARESAQTSGLLLGAATVGGFGRHDIFNPRLALPTRVIGQSTYGTATPEVWSSHVTHNVNAAYDGFTLSTSTGTMTGSLLVYGYRKA